MTTLPQTSTPTSSTPGTPFPDNDPVLVGAGDIARCSSNGDEATADLLDSIPGTVFTTGDNVYEDGTASEFANCYDPSWGRHKARTYPSVGNHDYLTKGAAGYFDYFGSVAGDPDKGYYSYELGTWHIIVLNSQCGQVGGCNVWKPTIRLAATRFTKSRKSLYASLIIISQYFRLADGQMII